jgi:hypothetical protein
MATEEHVPLSVVQEKFGSILTRLSAEPTMALAAAANPLLALEELGFSLDLDGRLDLQDRSRFGKWQIAERRRLRKTVFEHAGRRFDLDDSQVLHVVLTRDLRLALPLLPEQLASFAGERDPLQEHENVHPVMVPLLAYRRLDARSPKFAPPALYRRIRSGELAFPNLRLRARPKA